MSDEEELSAEEMDALLRDLESRASSNPKSEKEVDAFLDEPAPKKKAPTANKAPEPDLPKEAPKAELEPADEPKAAAKKSKKSKVKVVSRGKDEDLAKKLRLVLLLVVAPILFAATWVLGMYLGPIVSAGWLVGVVSLVGLLVIPLILRLSIRKGSFVAWTGLVSALTLVGLLAIVPSFASKRMIQYGHWPASAIGQIAGWAPDNWMTGANVSVASWIAGLLHTPVVIDGKPAETIEARKLGTTDTLTAEASPESDSESESKKAASDEATPEEN